MITVYGKDATHLPRPVHLCEIAGVEESVRISTIRSSKPGYRNAHPVSALVGYAEAERIPLPEKPSTTAIELNLNENLRRVDSNLPRRCNAITAIQGAVESAERTVST